MRAKLLPIAGKIALGALLAVILGALTVVTVLPRAVHGHALNVLTGSMDPTIPAGSIVVIRPVDPATLEVGDVITFQRKEGKSEYVTHRIVEVHSDTTPVMFTTKGDANPGPDLEPVPVTAVRGQVWLDVPHLGAWRDALRTGGVGLLAVVLGLVAYAVSQVASAVRDRRSERHGGADLVPPPEVVPASAVTPAPATPEVRLELLVAAVAADLDGQRELGLLVASFNGAIVRADERSVSLTVVGEPQTLDQVVSLLSLWSEVEVRRSGVLTVGHQPDREPAHG